MIATISAEPVTAEGATRIAGDGRTLMPGLIDAHWHALLVRPTPAEATYGDVGLNNLVAGAEATDTLMRGFTTVRDMGGPVFGLKQAMEDGIGVFALRIYPSGAIITVTSGHGDFRQLSELPRIVGGPLTRMEAIGGSMVADSPDEVRLRFCAADAGGLADQAHGWWRRRITAQSARRLDASPPRSSVPRQMPPATGAPTSRCMPIPPRRSSGRSP